MSFEIVKAAYRIFSVTLKNLKMSEPCPWLQMAWLEMDWNLKKLASFNNFLACNLEKNTKI